MNTIDPEIIIAVLAGEATDEQERSLARWRAQDPENESEYLRLARLWTVTGEIEEPLHGRPVPSARAIAEIAEARSTGSEVEEARPHPASRPTGAPDRWSRWRVPALAASLILGLGLGSLLSETGEDEPFGPRALVTGANEVATVTLEDETVVRLAPLSRLEFLEDGDARDVSLEGRAYFAVARRPEQPFHVRLAEGEIEVLGTRFDVQSRDEDVQVAVVEGTVRMSARGGRVVLGPDEVARTTRGAPQVEQVEDVFRVVDWLGRFLAFESTPLDQVVQEFERRFGIEIEIADSELSGRTVTGWFADQAPEEMVASICTVVAARCTARNGTIQMEISSKVDGLNSMAGAD